MKHWITFNSFSFWITPQDNCYLDIKNWANVKKKILLKMSENNFSSWLNLAFHWTECVILKLKNYFCDQKTCQTRLIVARFAA
jgi:hypothetical protein